MLLAANYHYVGRHDFPQEGIFSLSVAQFLEQVGWLKRHFRLIGLPELLDLVERQRDFSEKLCLLTFDDGLRCHSEIVAPLMKKYGFPAAFFVGARPISERRATDIHKSHAVRAMVPPKEVEERLRVFLRERGDDPNRYLGVPEDEVLSHYRYDELSVARVKYWVNYRLDSSERTEFVDGLFAELFQDETKFVDEWYMSPSDVRKMHRDCGCIGSHAWSHEPLASMTSENASHELLESRQVLERITGERISTVSYPLGNLRAVGRREGDLARSAGYQIGFTMERSANLRLHDPLLFGRVDCNDLPEVGKAPLLAWKDGQLCGKDGVVSARRRYYAE